MRHALFKHILLSGVSFGAVDIAVEAARSAHLQRYSLSKTHGFLARIGLWLQLVFGGPFGREVSASHVTYVAHKPPNRHKARLRRRNLPLARRPDTLAHHFLRRYGYVRFWNWMYDRTLTSRIAWCFRDWNWRWAPREDFAACESTAQRETLCAALLCPD